MLLLSEDLAVAGGTMHVDVLDLPASKTLAVKVNGHVGSSSRIFTDYVTSGAIPAEKRPSTGVSAALPTYEGTWGRFSARFAILDDGKVRLTLQAPQAIQTGYTAECRISYAF